MARLFSRADFSRLAGVSDSAIAKACKHRLAPACIGSRIDVDHVSAVEYLADKGASPPPPEQGMYKPRSAPPAPRPEKPVQPPPKAAEPVPERRVPEPGKSLDSDDIQDFLDLTVREVIERHGTVTAFKDLLDARKKIADIHEKDLKNDETTGRLIERELVRTHVFSAIDAAWRRLLSDATKTITRTLYGAAKGGVSVEESEKTVRDILASHLRPVKATATRVLRDA